MKCPKCKRGMVKRRNYTPSQGFLPGYTWTHEYSLSEALTNRSLCTHIIEEAD